MMIGLERTKQILGKHKKIGVIGDLMVDEYLWGDVSRISPEAPVPIIEINEEHIRLGGSANVSKNLIGLGQQVVVFGIVGSDRMGTKLKGLMRKIDIDVSGVIECPERPTTVKTRIIGSNQHIARVDKESVSPIKEEDEIKLLEKLEDKITNLDALILEDYNKGVLTESVIRKTINLCKANNVITAVDPKYQNFSAYKGVTLFKPNKKETEDALQVSLKSEDDILAAGNELLKRMEAEFVLITLGSRGMALFQHGDEPYLIPTVAKDVADVSGAGDTVIGTLATVLANGGTVKDAVLLANIAAGIVCSHVGVASITTEEILTQIEKRSK